MHIFLTDCSIAGF